MYTHNTGGGDIRVHGKIQRWGNSLGIRIKKSIAEEIQLKENSEVDITVSGDQLILTPVSPRYTLEDLIDGITQENLHSEVNSGGRVGMEEW